MISSISNSFSTHHTYPKNSNSVGFRGVASIGNTILINGKTTTAKVFTSNLDYTTFEQIKNIASHPVFKNTPIRIMPDTHAGKTAVVGFTAPVDTKKGIIPGLIGGDIGCGMLCVEIDTKGKDVDFNKLDDVIKTYVSGQNPQTPSVQQKLSKKIVQNVDKVCDSYKISSKKSLSTLGTLGGGNHFIELDKDKFNNTYLVIHTGSRAFGNDVYQHHSNIAKNAHPYNIKDLSYLQEEDAKKYLKDADVAIQYSKINRRIIADEILHRMGWKEKSSFETIHNYIANDGIMRKGSIKAENKEKVIIPLNMRDGAIIGTGKGNIDWNNSAPHGAGRQFSRAEASELIELEDYKTEMRGIHTSCISEHTKDEAPQAYKNSDEIINNIKETVDIVDIIKPIFNYKD